MPKKTNGYKSKLNFTRIFLLRHPQVSGADSGRFWGHSDVPLSKDGKKQIKQVVDRMSEERIQAIYSSDLQRTRQLADAIGRAQRPRRKVEAMPDFRELSLGVWEGMTYQEIENKYPEELAARMANMPEFCITDGESLNQMAQRVMPAFQDMVAAHQGENICLVAHAGVNRVILSKIMGAPLDRIFRLDQAYACLNIIDVFEDGLPLIRLMNQTTEP